MKERNTGATVAIIGGGGREDNLKRKYLESTQVDRILMIPGNGMSKDGVPTGKRVQTFPNFQTTDVEKIIQTAKRYKATLIDVAQDNAVKAGVADAAVKEGILAMGPTSAAGRIEHDKVWARQLGRDLELDQPDFWVFEPKDEKGIKRFLARQDKDREFFVKVQGLAKGKGARHAGRKSEVLPVIRELAREFPESSDRIIIEERMYGEEFSIFAFCDGQTLRFIGAARDHKKSHDKDQGENTGGMGCSTPHSALTSEDEERIQVRIIEPVITALFMDKTPFHGVLYLGGFLIKKRGKGSAPYITEWNARWGDPEAQVLLDSIENDYYEIATAIAKGDIRDILIKRDGLARVSVAIAAKGYPDKEAYERVIGKRVFGLDEARDQKGVHIYGHGIKKRGNVYRVAGGRVAHVRGEGEDVLEARERAYAAVKKITIEGDNQHYRTDIGLRDVERLGSKE